MTKHNPENERVKRHYYDYLKEAKRHGDATVDAVAKAISRFEEYTGHRNFKAFHVKQAIAFKKHLSEQTGQRSGEKLSKQTQHATLMQLKQFFFWLADRPGYKSCFQYTDADYFNLTEKDKRIATTQRERKAPTMEQVKRVIETMPHTTEIEQRDRSLFAFAILTGARDSAIASMKLKHIDFKEGCVYQDAREVKTKFSKTFTTYFFPVGDEVLAIAEEWVRCLREVKLLGNDDPLFPATRIRLNDAHQFEAAGLGNEHWSNAGPIRKIFQRAFKQAGLPYFHPHSFRKTLAKLGEVVCNTPEEFKAWSQNLGHEQVLTTFTSYGSVATDRQGDIIKCLNTGKTKQHSTHDLAREIARLMKEDAENAA